MIGSFWLLQNGSSSTPDRKFWNHELIQIENVQQQSEMRRCDLDQVYSRIRKRISDDEVGRRAKWDYSSLCLYLYCALLFCALSHSPCRLANPLSEERHFSRRHLFPEYCSATPAHALAGIARTIHSWCITEKKLHCNDVLVVFVPRFRIKYCNNCLPSKE